MLMFEVIDGEKNAELLLAAEDASPSSLSTDDKADECGREFASANSSDEGRRTVAAVLGVVGLQKSSVELNTAEK